MKRFRVTESFCIDNRDFDKGERGTIISDDKSYYILRLDCWLSKHNEWAVNKEEALIEIYTNDVF